MESPWSCFLGNCSDTSSTRVSATSFQSMNCELPDAPTWAGSGVAPGSARSGRVARPGDRWHPGSLPMELLVFKVGEEAFVGFVGTWPGRFSARPGDRRVPVVRSGWFEILAEMTQAAAVFCPERARRPPSKPAKGRPAQAREAFAGFAGPRHG
jgi:hypothetical protein